ncbi:MAG: hypothetical protein MSR29_08115 [Lachnospiraceae bacterium]|nr:hypothetical protein [Lachnospiraceae bacterium]
MLIANFTQRDEEIEVEGLWQYDYGQKLQINGLDLPAVFEVHFAYKGLEKAIPQTGYTQDGVSVVDIPNSALAQPKTISAYIYLSDASQGETTNKILLYMNKRIAPEGFEAPADVDLFHHTLEAVNEYAERTAESEKSAAAWVHGHEDYPDREEDNAAYYAGQAKESAEHAGDAVYEISGQVKDAKKSIDAYVAQKEHDLKGETGNVYFAAFKVVNGRLIMYSDPTVDKVRFTRVGSRLKYRLAL